MKKIRVGFVDFYNGFKIENWYQYRFLSQFYDIEIDNEHPDYLFFSAFGNKHLSFTNCIKIFWTGECQTPDFNFCDYAIGFDELKFGDRYLRFPLYFQYAADFAKMCQKHCFGARELQYKTGFCSFVYTNNNASPMRQNILNALNNYRSVASGGRFQNNVGGPVSDKIEFQSKYKFCIACENTSMPGYSTEKLVQAFASNAIPIYWGDPHINNQFNPRSFINVSDFESLDDLVAYVRRVDEDDNLYMEIMQQPALLDLQLKEKSESEVLAFYQHIFGQDIADAYRYNRYYWGEKIRKERIQESKAQAKTIIGKVLCFYNKYLYLFVRNHFPHIHHWLLRRKYK